MSSGKLRGKQGDAAAHHESGPALGAPTTPSPGEAVEQWGLSPTNGGMQSVPWRQVGNFLQIELF